MAQKSAAGRGLRVRVRSKGLKASSSRWLARQLNDPYVAEAKAKGYRSRAAFKLIELDDKFHFLKPGSRVRPRRNLNLQGSALAPVFDRIRNQVLKNLLQMNLAHADGW